MTGPAVHAKAAFVSSGGFFIFAGSRHAKIACEVRRRCHGSPALYSTACVLRPNTAVEISFHLFLLKAFFALVSLK